MALVIDTNQPDKPISGDSLMRRSVAGRKQQWTEQSTSVSSLIYLVAGGVFDLTVYFTGYSEEVISDDMANSENLVPWNESVTWQYESVWIGAADPAHLLGASTLTAGERKVVMYKNETVDQYEFEPGVFATHTTRYVFTNNDVADHIILYYMKAKYILFGEGSL